MPHPRNGYRIGKKRVPGTTTITGAFKNPGALMYWACEQGQKYPDLPTKVALEKERDEAADAGTLAHSMVEAYFNGKNPQAEISKDCDSEVRKKAQRAYESFEKWRDSSGIEVTHQEIALVDTALEYGGCIDGLCVLNGDHCLVDWKTSKSVYSSYLMQLAAYANLLAVGYVCDEHGVATEKKVNIEITGGFHLVKFTKGEHADFAHYYWDDLSLAFEQFKLFRQAYENDKKLRKRL